MHFIQSEGLVLTCSRVKRFHNKVILTLNPDEQVFGYAE